MGTFGRPCFAFVKTQIVGKTKFFDSLERHASGVPFFVISCFRERQRNPGADIQGAVERERRAVQGRAVLDDR